MSSYVFFYAESNYKHKNIQKIEQGAKKLSFWLNKQTFFRAHLLKTPHKNISLFFQKSVLYAPYILTYQAVNGEMYNKAMPDIAKMEKFMIFTNSELL